MSIATLNTAVRSPRGIVRVALALAGVFGLAVVATQMSSAPAAHASNGLHYQRGTYVDNGWLCYGWSNGAYHCTQRWHRIGNQLVSDNPNWVPNGSFIRGGAGQGAPAHSGSVQGSTSAGEPCRSTTYFRGAPSAWEVPPSCYAGIYRVNTRNYVYRPGFGWCNWWVEVMNPSRPNLLWGNYARGSRPRVGATVVFSHGVQGSDAGGHYARVVAIYPGGQWILISEMNFSWRGGGFGRVNYRYVHVGYGVSFIY